MLCLKVCHYSYFQWCVYFRGPWVSFDTTDEFSVRITKINSRIGVSWTHSLPFCFWPIFNSMNYCHINRQLLTTGSLGTFNKFVSSRFPSFDAPPSPIVWPCSFLSLFVFWLNSTCLLRHHSGISMKLIPLVHDESVHFMEMSVL